MGLSVQAPETRDTESETTVLQSGIGSSAMGYLTAHVAVVSPCCFGVALFVWEQGPQEAGTFG